MRDSIEKSDLVEGSNMEMYQDLMDKEVSLSIAKRGGMGLADMMERQMNQAQAMSTQDALRLQNPATNTPPVAMPLVPVQEGMSLKPNAIQAYEIQRQNGFKIGDKP